MISHAQTAARDLDASAGLGKDAIYAFGLELLDIHARGKLPILVGGTGLYIDAVLYDYQFSPEKGAKDSKNPRHLAPDTPRRRSELRSNTCIVGLQRPVEQTKERISHRVDAMLEAGFIEEVTGINSSNSTL